MIVCCLRAGDLPRDVGSFYLKKYHKTQVRKVGLSLIGSLLQQLIIAGAWQQILKKVIEIGFFLSGNVQMNLIRDTSYQTFLHIHLWFKWHAVFVNSFLLYAML